MGLKLQVHIMSGNNVAAQSPFVVVGLDKHLKPELYKTTAAAGGAVCTWDEDFELDFTTAMKNIIADGHPEPTYLTFNVFDAAIEGFPSVGSAGVLLENIKEHGSAQGEFPLVNGTGSLNLAVGPPEKKGWIHTKQAKTVGVVGAVAAGALAATLTARHIHNKKKEKEGQSSYQNGGR